MDITTRFMGVSAMKRRHERCDSADVAIRPFENLRDLLDGRPLKTGSSDSFRRVDARRQPSKKNRPKTEEELFRDAMADVTPIARATRHTAPLKNARQPVVNESGEKKVMDQLKRLVEFGHGFEVAQTPEYMEGRGYNVSREVTRRLYNGDFSIQGHIDLHGLNAMEARDAFLAFMDGAIAEGKRAVLIVHGRGLSSPVRPVLKSKVFAWLTRSAIRKWVIAFTSARSCDGGAGATYVLLRLRPVTKRFRKYEKRGAGPGRCKA